MFEELKNLKANTIAEQWELFNKLVVPGNAPEVQRSEMRIAFYAGAEAVLRIMWNIGEDSVSEEAATNMLAGLHEETRAFSREYGRQRRLPQDVIDAIARPEPRKHRA